ncbi:Predicted lipid-binding transport protein, Tim44 family [Meinhardsimonia xiamenensis]|jgi:predicted lipid-binding transport protein (Tim44 family)|uniref:Predicted lipid-binding transport protein, Tim44 family n=1 Tax=Meinhardsimonia xiamenensis TaxID=990712 RepID=A0A1G8Y4R8_9RHOB|nr:Tim44/TimA family putative adaptor protein [Meinhardsimonia xiamenensis]PRX37163.1 putative lipid-binding transport protein (Tim44 family) [Meinhardsimonia xiamenensis]SDJ97723.1 Predicted lipid-binding transport protein, Tim44 family [Meinhardsimonia xiamenensis]
MGSSLIQLLVLAAIAVFLILRLRSVLGTREGFEKPPAPLPREDAAPRRPGFEVIEGGPDRDITDHVPADSDAARALAAMKAVEPDFSVTEFLQGARAAYEMILMAYERGEIDELLPLLDREVYESFAEVIDQRRQQGLTIEANFVGIRDIQIVDAHFDPKTREAEITVRFVAEITSVVRNAEGEIVEGSPTEIKKQRDTWTFARIMGDEDPNWKLVATGE